MESNDTRHGNSGSQDVKDADKNLSSSRVDEIKSMSLDVLMTECRKHSDDYQKIHESIDAQYQVSGTITDLQSDTMAAFLLTTENKGKEEKTGNQYSEAAM